MTAFDEAEFWRARYARREPSGAQLGHEHAFIVREVLRRAARHASILDVGCGDGTLAHKYLKGLDQRWTGWDVSPDAIQTLRRRGLGEAVETDITQPRNVGTADLVVCFNVLYHLPTEAKVRQVLANIANACSKTAMILTWNTRVLERGPLGKQGKLAKHCFLWPLWTPPGHEVVEEQTIPGSPHKTLLVTRPTDD